MNRMKILGSTITVGTLLYVSGCGVSISSLGNTIHRTGIEGNPPNVGEFILTELIGSKNWSGYIDTAKQQPYTNITGSWKVPTVSGVNQSANAQWIGLGGVQSHDLLQVGTLETIHNGKQVDELFWEKLPSAAVPITAVQAGNTVKTKIKHISGSHWQVVANILNGSHSRTKRVNVTVNSQYAGQIEKNAEWISEDPSNAQYQILPLAHSGKVTFTDTTVNNLPISQTGTTTQKSVLLNSSGGSEITPSPLRKQGRTFSTAPHSIPRSSTNFQSTTGINGWGPSIRIPSDRSMAQLWSQLSQIEQQMNQTAQQWSSTFPKIAFPTTVQKSTSSNAQNPAAVQEWSGTTGGWHWSIQIYTH